MKLITKEIEDKLNRNTGDFSVDKPYLKLFTPFGNATLLISEIHYSWGEKLLFGLCDLGLGFPELGYVSLAEIEEMNSGNVPRIERDKYWDPKGSLEIYTKSAQSARGIYV